MCRYSQTAGRIWYTYLHTYNYIHIQWIATFSSPLPVESLWSRTTQSFYFPQSSISLGGHPWQCYGQVYLATTPPHMGILHLLLWINAASTCCGLMLHPLAANVASTCCGPMLHPLTVQNFYVHFCGSVLLTAVDQCHYYYICHC